MKPRLVASLVAAAVLASPAAAQTLSRYAPADSLMTLELNDLAGATRTAASFGRQVAAMDLLGAAPNDPALGLLGSALDREVLMALNLDRAGNPHVLLAARIPAANQKEIQGLVAKNLNDSRQAGKRVLSYRAGGLPFYSATSRDGSTENWGYEGGLLYFSDGLDVLAGFLRRAAGKAGGGLGGTRAYADAMNLAGPGHLRAWVNVGATGRMFNDLLAKDLMAEVGVNFAPVG
ncbi:MAG TPA: hypothetical protein VNT60_10475 [Deinococcales bacterium]|nr:hypothetical protein [Deinococcales bacterium]